VSAALVRALLAGEAALTAGDLSAAASAFAQARAEAPTDVSIAIALANVHTLQDDGVSRRAVLLDAFAVGDWQESAAAYALGTALLECGAPLEATVCLERVVKSHAKDPAALSALAGALRTQGRVTDAWPLAQRAAQLAPRQAAFLLTAAQVRHDLGDLIGARRWLKQAEQVRPNHGPTRVQAAYTSLIERPSAHGWALFEHRPLPVPTTGARPWNGEALQHASILVTAEQGVGDQFQFLRFVPLLPERGAARVIVECHPHAVELLVANGFDAVARGTVVETDFHVPLLSLPHRLSLDGDVQAARVPYMRAPASPDQVTSATRRVGLVWSGNAAFPGRFTRDLSATALTLLLDQLADVPNISVIALQQGTDLSALPEYVTRVGALSGWADTASQLAGLDLLITTDTGIAHLAGAMGVRTLVMLQHVPDWRWGLRGTRSTWYPTVELMRQRASADWHSVVEQVRLRLLTNE
jgi:tetratricopeptide (TPR) repeat protein